MKYVKPEMQIEKFILNNSVAATSCETDFVGSEQVTSKQQVTCAFSGNPEYVWNPSLSCNRTVLGIGYYEAGVNIGVVEAELRAEATGGAYDVTSNTSDVTSAGYYVYLEDGSGNDCVAQATVDVLKYYTNSY